MRVPADANRFELFGPLTSPQGQIHEITNESGQIIGTDSLGTMTFSLISPNSGRHNSLKQDGT